MLAESILSKNTTILMYIYIFFLNLLLLLFHDLLRHPSKCALKGFKETTELLMPPTKQLSTNHLKNGTKQKGGKYKKYINRFGIQGHFILKLLAVVAVMESCDYTIILEY